MTLAKALQAAAGNAAEANYIEDVFSTYLYTGNGSTQTITNGIDESGEGAMTWIKCRSTAYTNRIFDTTRGATKFLVTSSTAAEDTNASTLTAFSSSGFSVGASTAVNENAATYASWTFRKQPKFFDVVTWSGNSVYGRQIPHNLGSVPGCIIVKRTSSDASWYVYHRGVDATRPQDYTLVLDQTLARIDSSAPWADTAPTDSVFTVGDNSNYNASGSTYVAYLFAHNAGGFGLSGEDNVISCGSYTGNGSTSGPVVTLGYEPQWIMIKNASATTGGWVIVDNMRGLPVGGNSNVLRANVSGAESTSVGGLTVTATGFQQHDTDPNFNASGNTYIYIAIRRGPMKVPTTGTSVFTPIARAGTSATATVTSGFTTDAVITKARNTTYAPAWFSRLQGAGKFLYTFDPQAENTAANSLSGWDNNTGYVLGNDNAAAVINFTANYVNYALRRAPGFFDEVCCKSINSQTDHNLGVAPELVIYKNRSTGAWYVCAAANGFGVLNTTAAWAGTGNGSGLGINLANATTTAVHAGFVFTGSSGASVVIYLFASCPGVSKVGSYTGTGTTQQINCGFTGGARFVLIKRADSTGDWYVWDSARGIVAGNDPYLLLNSTAAEVTSTDYVDTYSAGFEISSTAPAAINASGGTFVFLAIA